MNRQVICTMASQWTIRQAVNTEIELFHSCIQTKRMYIARNDPDDPNLAITRNGHTIVECGQIMFIKLANFLFNLCNWYFFAVDVCHRQIIGRPGEVEPQIGSFQSLFFAKFFLKNKFKSFRQTSRTKLDIKSPECSVSTAHESIGSIGARNVHLILLF